MTACNQMIWDGINAKCTHEQAKNDMYPDREKNLIHICLGMEEYCVFKGKDKR